MPGSLTNYGEGQVLGCLFGGVALTPPAIWHLAFFSTAPTDAGGGTELSGTGYSRKAITNNTTNFPAVTAGNPILLAVDQSCFTAGAEMSDAVALGLFDASSGGNLWFWGWLGDDDGKIFTAATDDAFTAPGHGLANGDKVRFLAVPGTTLPTGVTAGVTYHVRDVSGATFKVAATAGGSAVDITAAGSGLVAKIAVKAIGVDDVIRVLANALSIALD